MSGGGGEGELSGRVSLGYIGCPERPGNNERSGRRGNFIARRRSMCAAWVRSVGGRREVGGKRAWREEEGASRARFIEFSKYPCTRRVEPDASISLQPLSISLFFFSLSHLTFRSRLHPPFAAVVPSPFFPLPHSLRFDTPFSRFPAVSLSFPLERRFHPPTIPDFSISRLSRITPRCESGNVSKILEIENHASQEGVISLGISTCKFVR